MDDALRLRPTLLDRAVAALRLFCIYGAVGVLVDADHFIRPVQLLLAGQTPALADIAGRPLHWPVFILCGLICGSICTLSLGRLVMNWLDTLS